MSSLLRRDIEPRKINTDLMKKHAEKGLNNEFDEFQANDNKADKLIENASLSVSKAEKMIADAKKQAAEKSNDEKIKKDLCAAWKKLNGITGILDDTKKQQKTELEKEIEDLKNKLKTEERKSLNSMCRISGGKRYFGMRSIKKRKRKSKKKKRKSRRKSRKKRKSKKKKRKSRRKSRKKRR